MDWFLYDNGLRHKRVKYSWKASYKMKFLIFLINTYGEFISYNVDKIVFILFNTSNGFFFQLKHVWFIAFMLNLFLILFWMYWLWLIHQDRSSHRKCSLKKGLKVCKFIKKRLQHKYFITTPIDKNICERLLPRVYLIEVKVKLTFTCFSLWISYYFVIESIHAFYFVNSVVVSKAFPVIDKGGKLV